MLLMGPVNHHPDYSYSVLQTAGYLIVVNSSMDTLPLGAIPF
jgi:hypothetical protein